MDPDTMCWVIYTCRWKLSAPGKNSACVRNVVVSMRSCVAPGEKGCSVHKEREVTLSGEAGCEECNLLVASMAVMGRLLRPRFPQARRCHNYIVRIGTAIWEINGWERRKTCTVTPRKLVRKKRAL